MKKILFQILAAASLMIGVQAANAQSPLLVTAAAATDGVGTQTARLAIAVSAADGSGVGNLTAANFQFGTFGLPVGGSCGFNTIVSVNYTAGVYLMKVAMPNLAMCSTVKGEYLMSVNVSSGTSFAMIPVKLTVK